MQLLKRLEKAAHRLKPLRGLGLLCIPAGCIVFAFSIFASPTNEYDHLMIPGVVLALWGLIAFGFITCFQSVPPIAPEGAKRWLRFTTQTRRAGYWIIGVMTLVLTVAVAYLSFRLVMIWLTLYG